MILENFKRKIILLFYNCFQKKVYSLKENIQVYHGLTDFLKVIFGKVFF